VSDTREIDAPQRQIALGFVIVEYPVVPLAMIVLSAIGIGAEESGNGSRSVARVPPTDDATFVTGTKNVIDGNRAAR
jgi:hypothetical protein